MNDPILRTVELPQPQGRPHRFTVTGGLNHLSGNHAPYFSLQYTETGPHGFWSGGAADEQILKLYPELADLAALHLSDIDGVPMHAEANGWYWLSGALGGLGERYHGGNGSPTQSEAECLAIFAGHCRITGEEASAIRSRALMESASHDDPSYARAFWQRELETMRPRWKREAEAAIEKHGLVVYGDPWQQEEVRA